MKRTTCFLKWFFICAGLMFFSCSGGGGGGSELPEGPGLPNDSGSASGLEGVAVGFSLQSEDLISYRLGLKISNGQAVFTRLASSEEVLATIPVTGSGPWQMDSTVQFRPANENTTYDITLKGTVDLKEGSTAKYRARGTYEIKSTDNQSAYRYDNAWEAESLDWGVVDTGYPDVDFKKVMSDENGGVWLAGEWEDDLTGNILLIYSDDKGHTWEKKFEQSSSVTDSPLYIKDLARDGIDTIWLSTSQGLYKGTKDTTFQSLLQSGFNLDDNSKLYFSDADNGFIIGSKQEKPYMSTTSRFLYQTVDGGKNWTDITDTLTNETINWINDFYWVDRNTGWILINDNKLIHTSDGGNSWTTLPPIPSGSRTEMFYFIDAQTGWLDTYKTTDSGQTWHESSATPDYYSQMSFYDRENGWLISGGNLYQTSDGGDQWTMVNASLGLTNIRKLIVKNDSEGYIFNYPDLYKTTDSGVNWNKVQGIDSFPVDLKFFNQNSGVLIGDEGLQWTSDGGISWQKTVPGHYETYFFVSDQIIKRVHYPSLLSGTEDGGQNWQVMSADIKKYQGFTRLEIGNSIWVSYQNTLINSQDNGQTWKIIQDQVYISDIRASTDGLYLATENWSDDGTWHLTLKKTIDNGGHWMDLPEISQEPNTFSLMPTGNTIWFNLPYGGSGNDLPVLLTLDQGTAWEEVDTKIYSHLELFDIGKDGRLFAYGLKSEAGNYTKDGQKRFVVSEDDGLSWEETITPYSVGHSSYSNTHFFAITRETVLDAEMPDTDTGWIVGDKGLVLKYLSDSAYGNYDGAFYSGTRE